VSDSPRRTSLAELPGSWQALVREALAARELAWAPYSRFRVGAAVGLADGGIRRGCNVESPSYGLTVCAERVALLAARADGAVEVEAIAVVGPDGPAPVSPCGACRQVILDLAGDVPVILATPAGIVDVWSAADLLPAAFGEGSLHREPESPA